LLIAAGAVVLAAPAAACAYDWPLKPLDRPHPIRGAFDDPREHEGVIGSYHSFHFGVDICAPDGTPVYAVEGGTIYRYRDAVAVRQGPGHEFAYWHVETTLPEHSYVAKGQEIGRIRPGWGHVHFAERVDGVYVNPLRPGGLEPFTDTTTPVVDAIDLTDEGAPVDRAHVTGDIDLVADAYDLPPLAPPPPWEGSRWTPALVRWRITRDDRDVVPWETAADFRTTLLQPDAYDLVYATGTHQDHPGIPGDFRFWLTRSFDTTLLADGTYRLEVAASDTRGNTGRAFVDFTVANRPGGKA
jgi:hypothetical protein